MHADIFYFYLIRSGWFLLVDGEWRACGYVAIRDFCTIDLKLTLRKTMQLKNMQHVLSIGKILISGLLLCKMDINLCLS